jgi:hypothetical protein
MGLLNTIARLFGGARSAGSNGMYLRVRCDACGEIVQTRINPSAELSLSDDGQSYFVRKVLVGQRCFRQIEVIVRYADLGRTETGREVHGGTSVPDA